MKKVIALTLACIMALTLCSCGSTGDSSSGNNVSTKHLTLDITQSDNSTMHQGALKFAELVEEYTDGRYAVDVYTNAALAAVPSSPAPR